MLSGNFEESATKCLDLKDVDGDMFAKVLHPLGGRDYDRGLRWGGGGGLHEMQQVAIVAERFQIVEVFEDAMTSQLSLGACLETLAWSGVIGLRRLESASRILAAD